MKIYLIKGYFAMKQPNEFEAAIEKMNSKSSLKLYLVDNREEKAVAYKLLKNYAKLRPDLRASLFPSLKDIAGNLQRIKP